MISICTLKICGDSTLKPLELIFKSCIKLELFMYTHDNYQSLDDGLETRGVFLDISKAFDRVWHEGLLFKLKQNGISGNLLNVITDILYQRKQRVVLNGQHSS